MLLSALQYFRLCCTVDVMWHLLNILALHEVLCTTAGSVLHASALNSNFLTFLIPVNLKYNEVPLVMRYSNCKTGTVE